MRNLIFFIAVILSKITLATNIVFLGDSLTEGYGVEKSLAFVSLVEKSLKDSGYDVNVINASISGSTSASALGRAKWLARSNPKIVVLALGANDGLRGLPIASLKKNLKDTIEFFLNLNVKILLTGILIPPNYGPDYTTQFESVYSELANEYDIDFMPFLLDKVAGEAKYNLADGIHPNPLGHEVIALNILPYIQKMIENLE